MKLTDVPFIRRRPSDVVGTHVAMLRDGRSYLGTVRYLDHETMDASLEEMRVFVHHFNGQEWDVEQPILMSDLVKV